MGAEKPTTLVDAQVIAFFMALPFLGSSLIFMIVYVWSRRNPTNPVAIWGAFRAIASDQQG